MTEENLVQVAFVAEEGANLPTYQTKGSAGMDLTIVERVELAPMERKLARTGLKVALPHGYEAQIRPRSGLALKKGISMVNTPGTIDSDYRGEIGIILINFSDSPVVLEQGERVAQMVVQKVEQIQPVLVQNLEDTERGEGGFGSTGT